MDELRVQITLLQQQFERVLEENRDLREEIENIKNYFAQVVDPKEIMYQKLLEKKLGASHTKTIYGMTDIETADSIIEIKRWANYKCALGQLIAYSANTSKSKCVYFFGNPPKYSDAVVRLFTQNNISVYQLSLDNTNELVIETLLENKNKFVQWLESHVVKQNNSVLELANVCQLYTHQAIGTKKMQSFKLQIEHFVNTTFPELESKYQNTTRNGKSYRGWYGLTIVN
jgi:hemerythrin-like domain-containing protein